MQYLDNDMDELFNKAGRDYPLKTDNADWEKVAGMLQGPESVQLPTAKKKWRRFGWLLLLPLGLLLFELNDGNRIASGPANEKERAQIREGNNGTKPLNDGVNREGRNVGSPGGSGIIKPGTSAVKEPEKTGFIEPHENAAAKPHAGGNIAHQGNIPSASSDKIGRGPELQGSASRGATLNLSEHAILKEAGKTPKPVFSLPYPIALLSYEKATVNGAKLPVNDSTANGNAETNKKKEKTQSVRHWSLGLIAGPDATTIRGQKINDIGYNVGLITGYRLNKNWSFETGLLIARKEYFTDGKHFDKSKTGIPPMVKIINVDGWCRMFEVPLAVRYDLPLKRSSVFATVGANSYFMQKEDYNYKAYNAGSYYEWSKAYKHTGNHFFSNMQLSLGYNYQLSPRLSLRAEPYVKIPFSKIGIGQMPVTSAGMYVGIMRNFR